jgi:hypothetical protein
MPEGAFHGAASGKKSGKLLPRWGSVNLRRSNLGRDFRSSSDLSVIVVALAAGGENGPLVTH